MNNKVLLYANTIKYLKPSQVYYRILNKFKRALYKKRILRIKTPDNINVTTSVNYMMPELDYNKNYLKRFNTEDILKNRFTFINLTNKVELTSAWNDDELQHLWRYNLHYFEYLYKLAYEYSEVNEQDIYYRKYKELIINWIDNNQYAQGDGWHPYTISLRITNWISTYIIFKDEIIHDNDFNKKFIESIYLQYKYLQRNLEKDVLGNHYFENIKAIIIGSIFFKEKNVKDKFKSELIIQLREQILKDGMHFELSPMYHKIILEALIKITYLLKNDEIYNDLIYYIQKMIDVTYSFENNFGKTPAFNDSAEGVSKEYKALLEATKNQFGLNPKTKHTLNKSGFYIIEDSRKKLVFNTSEISPTYLPAHGHCDALSFEVSLNGSPFIVNSGTYQYEYGKWRDFFRSTKAHNTISVDNHEQSQFWGSFRVAKRIKKVRRKKFIYNDIQFYAGSYVSFKGVKHKRFIGYINENTMIFLDYVDVISELATESYLHFIPEANIAIKNDKVVVDSGKESINLTAIGVEKINIKQGWYSDQFNVKEENKHLIFNKEKTSEFFGYIIEFNSDINKIKMSENEIKVSTGKEFVINFNELGAML